MEDAETLPIDTSIAALVKKRVAKALSKLKLDIAFFLIKAATDVSTGRVSASSMALSWAAARAATVAALTT